MPLIVFSIEFTYYQLMRPFQILFYLNCTEMHVKYKSSIFILGHNTTKSHESQSSILKFAYFQTQQYHP